MEVTIKYRIGDYVYYGDENSCHQGCIKDINVIFWEEAPPIIKYKVDKEFNIPHRLWSKDEIRYQEFDESNLHLSPYDLIERQIRKFEIQISNLTNKIKELKGKLK